MESQEVLCCGAKKWALVIGWIQAVSSAVSIGIFSVTIIWFFVVSHHHQMELEKMLSSDPENRTAHEIELVQLQRHVLLGVTSLVLIILATVISLAAGVVLIRGVQDRNAKKLKTWMLIEFIFLVFIIVGIIVGVIGGAGADSVILDVLSVFITLFFMWVVNVHRQELLGNSAGQVIYASDKL